MTKQVEIISHRGLHDSHRAPNSLDSIENALRSGYGAELDLRLEQGRFHGDLQIVLSHDNPPCTCSPTVGDLVACYERYCNPKKPQTLLLNIKEDGLVRRCVRDFKGLIGAKKPVYFFDMSIPESVLFDRMGLPVLNRISDIETPVELKTSGYWVDGFKKDYPQEQKEWYILPELFSYSEDAIYFVSPELHGRSYENFWSNLKEHISSGLFDPFTRVGICTEESDKAKEFFK